MLATMPERLLVHTGSLHAAAARFDAAGADLTAALERLRAGLGPLGDVCGADEAGRTLAADLDPARRRVEAAVTNLAACSAGTARGLRSMADAVDAAERAASIPDVAGA
jgi:uncharacterized protein YukE